MNNVRRSILLALVLGASLVSIASTASAADTGGVQIQRIAPWSAGTQVQVPMQLSCTGGSSTNQLNIPNGGPDTVAGRNFQLALAAYLAGKSVNINWTCSGTTPTVVSVRF